MNDTIKILHETKLIGKGQITTFEKHFKNAKQLGPVGYLRAPVLLEHEEFAGKNTKVMAPPLR